jgi:hypothetical protein
MTGRERDAFIAGMAAAGVALDVSRAFLRLGTTLNRLAVAQCNGDWPADNGERKVLPCASCEMCWSPSVLRGPGKRCPDCRTTARAIALGREHGLEVIVQGDPRGAVLLVKVAGRELVAG